MNRVVLAGALRTPIGKIRGALSGVRPDDLLAGVFAEVVRRAGVDPAEVDEVVAGCANQAGEDNRNVARMAWLLAGMPVETPALTVNRLCASGLSAVVHAVRAVRVGDAELVVAGGVESMTRAPWVMAKPDRAFASGNPAVFDTSLGWRFPNPKLAERFPLEAMGETAENLAERYEIARGDQDELALRSHQRAVAAQAAGRFAAELVPVEVKEGHGKVTVGAPVAADEGPRSDTTLEKLGTLAPAFRPGGSVTAGNASTLNDGAAALIVTTPERAKAAGMAVLGEVRGWGAAGVDPRFMGIGPVPASRAALKRAGLGVQDLELVEINEAFAVQVLAAMRELRLDPERVNVNGGAIALGHPLGCSGVRILTTLVHEMARREAGIGLATMCVGVGQGESLIVTRD